MSESRQTRLRRNTGLWLMVLGLYLYGLFDQGVFGGFVMGAGAMLVAQNEDVLQLYTAAAFDFLASLGLGDSGAPARAKSAKEADPGS